MGSADDVMDIDELSTIYRVEKKSGSLTSVRADLYRAMADLLRRQRREYDDYLRKDPEDLKCEGANSRRKKGAQLSRDIIEMRMGKINKMALRGAMGESHSLDNMTSEEKEYYNAVLALSKNHKALLDRLSGNIRYTNAKITGEPIPVPEAAPVAENVPEPEVPASAEQVPVPEAVPAEEPAGEPPAEFEAPIDIVPEEGDFEMEDEPEPEIPDDELDRMPPDAAVEKQEEPPEEEYSVLRILQDLPEFAGPLRNYSLKREQIVRIPNELAQALVNRGLAKKVSVSPERSMVRVSPMNSRQSSL